MFNSSLSRRSLLLSTLAFLVAPLLALWGCSQFGDAIKCTTEVTLTVPQLRTYFPNHIVIVGDTTYAEVNPLFAPKWHDYTGRVMSLLGMSPNWSQQFDCNRFANVKLAVIHVRFLVDTWHARKPGASPAVAEFWYTPHATPGGIAYNRGKPGHAILVTIEGGKRVFRDIYSAKTLNLTQHEVDSAYLVKF